MMRLVLNSKMKAFHRFTGNPIPLRRCYSSIALDSVSKFAEMVRNRCQLSDLSVSEAVKFLNVMSKMSPMPSIWTFNRLIASLSKMNQCSIVLSMYKSFARSRRSDFEPDVHTLTVITKCLCVSHSAKSGFSVLSVAIKTGVCLDSLLMNTLLEGLCNEGSSMASAMELFEKMTKRNKHLCDVVTYGTIISGFCKAGEARIALSVLRKMIESYEIGLKPKKKDGVEHHGALSMLKRMICGGEEDGNDNEENEIGIEIEPNLYCFSTVIKSLYEERKIDEALGLFRDMIARGVRPDVRMYSIVICSLCKNERLDEAVSHFESMTKEAIKPDIVVFTSLIIAMWKSGRFEEASRFYDQMSICSVTPDLVAFNTMTLPLCEIGRPKDAIRQLEAMIALGTIPNIVNYNTLIHGLCQFGYWNEVDKVLEKMKLRGVPQDVMTYNIRVEALLKAGKVRKALPVFEQMNQANLRPQIDTYCTLLWKLCHLRLVHEAERVFNKMASQNIFPDERTCNALLDLLSKKGRMDKAQKAVDKLVEFRQNPSVVTYATLMKGYCEQSLVEKAHEIFDKVTLSMGVSPNLEACCCVLVDGYVSIGRVTDAKKLLDDMVEKGLTSNEVAQSILKKSQAKRTEGFKSLLQSQVLLG